MELHNPTLFAPPLSAAPRRVVSLAPCLTETLFDLDLGARVIAVSADCTRPPNPVQLLPRGGAPYAPDVERIVALGPDLVLLDSDLTPLAHAEALRAARVALWAVRVHAVTEAITLLWNLMEAFDHAVMVPRVREIERAYEYTAAAAQSMPRVRVAAVTVGPPWTTFNRGTYAHNVLRVCGGDNVFANATERLAEVTWQEVAAAQPEIVLVAEGARAEAERALRGVRVVSIDGSLLTWYGTRLAYALRDLPGLLMGESA